MRSIYPCRDSDRRSCGATASYTEQYVPERGSQLTKDQKSLSRSKAYIC